MGFEDAARQASLLRLLARCDVFIHNLRRDAIERLGLGYDTIRALHPRLVYVHCTGFGEGGPYSGRPAYDDIIQAASGAASLLPRADGNPAPRYLPMAMADKVAGLHATYAVLGALLHRERTGQGQSVEVPMFESFTHFLLQEHLYGRAFIPPTDAAGYPRQLDPLRQPLEVSRWLHRGRAVHGRTLGALLRRDGACGLPRTGKAVHGARTLPRARPDARGDGPHRGEQAVAPLAHAFSQSAIFPRRKCGISMVCSRTRIWRQWVSSSTGCIRRKAARFRCACR